jgi:hypothetical protein
MRIRRLAGVTVAVAGMALGHGFATPAKAQDLSEKSVQTFLTYAWSLTPARFTKPDGSVVEINKDDPDKVVVPLDMAREVIKVGRLSAHAQVCELPEEQVMNYRSLMIREENKKKWSDQQMIFMNQLHLVTVMLLTGKIALVEKGENGGKDVVIQESKAPAQTCSAEQKEKVRSTILAYVKTGPELGPIRPIMPRSAPAAAAGGPTAEGGAADGGAAAKASAPAPAPKKK